MTIDLSRRQFLTGISLSGMNPSLSGGGVLSGLVSTGCSASHIFDAIDIPRNLKGVEYLMHFGCSQKEYLILKEKYRSVFEELIQCIPSHMCECIDYEQSFFSRSNITFDQSSIPNEGLSASISFKSHTNDTRINIILSGREERARFCIWDMVNGGRKNLRSLTPVSFSEVISTLDQPFDKIVEGIQERYHIESQERSIETEREMKSIEERGFMNRYSKYLNNSFLTPISQLVEGIINPVIPLGSALRISPSRFFMLA